MAVLAEPLDAAKAERWGLVNECLPADQLEPRALEVARKIVEMGPPNAGPAAGGARRDLSARLGHIKTQINSAWEQSMWQTFREEVALFSVAAGELPEDAGPGGH
jgi:enoyl-CoA hydratase/carnithine racemase